MKRLRWRSFAFLIFLSCLYSSPSFAQAVIRSFAIRNMSSAGNNVGIGHTVRFDAIATSGANPWQIPPRVDLSAIGGPSSHPLTHQGGEEYVATYITTDRTSSAAPNHLMINFTVSATPVGGSQVQRLDNNNLYFDLVKPVAANQSIKSNNANPNIIRTGNTFTVSIKDSRFQSQPAETTAWVNLSDIGGGSKELLNHLGDGNFSRTFNADTYLPRRIFNGTVPISIKDHINDATTVNVTINFDNYLYQSSLNSTFLTLAIDNGSDGVANIGDTIKIETIATFTEPATAWTIAPRVVDLSAIGLGANIALERVPNTSTYRKNFILSERINTPNYANLSFKVEAQANYTGSTLIQDNTNSFDFDLVVASGSNPLVTPTTISRNDSFTISITDNNYQANPSPGTVATVDLSPIGGLPNQTIDFESGKQFKQIFQASSLANSIYNGPLTITLRDPFSPSNPAKTYQTPNINFDNRPIGIDSDTRIEIRTVSGTVNATAKPGSIPNVYVLPDQIIRVVAVVDNYDGATSVYASAPTLIASPPDQPGDLFHASSAIKANTFKMTLQESTPNGKALWQDDIRVKAANLRNSEGLSFTISFINGVGAVTTQVIRIRIDLKPPVFSTATTRVLLPNEVSSPVQDIATTTCKLQFSVDLQSDGDNDINSVSVNLGAIGGPALLELEEVGVYKYMATYTIPAGTLDDLVVHQFTFTANDEAGNISTNTGANSIGIDNLAPLINSVTMTKEGAAGNVVVGDKVKIVVDVSEMEDKTGGPPTASVSVDLSLIGLSATYQIPHKNLNIYEGTFTLPRFDAVTPPVVPVDGQVKFDVYANDTAQSVASGRIVAHTKTSQTNSLYFDNRSSKFMTASTTVLMPNDSLSPVQDIATATTKLRFFAELEDDGFGGDNYTVTVDLSGLGGPSTYAMAHQGSYRYMATYTILAGNLDDAQQHSFLITASDISGNVVSFPAPTADGSSIGIDNSPPVVNSAKLTSVPPGSNIVVGSQFTVEVDVNGMEITTGGPPTASVSVDLSSLGFSSTEKLDYDSGTIYKKTFTLPRFDAVTPSVPPINENKQFQYFVNDTADSPKHGRIVAHTLMGLTPAAFFDNRSSKFVTASTTVLMPDNSLSAVQDIATATTKLRFYAELEDDGFGGDNYTVTVDLSAIGESSTYPMPHQGTYKYVATYTIPLGTLEDAQKYGFLITASDTSGNVVSFPAPTAVGNELGIDNSLPVINSVTITANPPGNVVVGSQFTIEVDASNLEITTGGPPTASVSVDLSLLGFSATEPLPLDSGNIYKKTFTLPRFDAVTPAVAPVDRNMQFNLCVNDTADSVNSGRILAHRVTAQTPIMFFDNRSSKFVSASTTVLLADDSLSPIQDIATLTTKLRFFAELEDDGFGGENYTVSVDLSPLGADPEYPLVHQGAYKYLATFSVVLGNLDDTQKHAFRITASDTSGNVVSFPAPTSIGSEVGVDNSPPVINSLKITPEPPGNVLVGSKFTIELDISGMEKTTGGPPVASVCVDLSALGFSASETIGLDSGTVYKRTFTMPRFDAAPYPTSPVTGNKQFNVYANDTADSAANGRIIAHIVASLTESLFFDNRSAAFEAASATVMLPHGVPSPIRDVATTTCKIEFFVQLEADGTENDYEVSVDLSVLGESQPFPLPNIAGGKYKASYEIKPGNLDDIVDGEHIFKVTASNTNGNIVLYAAQPYIRVDNIEPVIKSAVVSSNSPSGNIIIGHEYTVEARVDGVEVTGKTAPDQNASVTVDLSFVGGSKEATLEHKGGDLYSSTFELESYLDAGVNIVEASKFFVVSVNDTVFSTSSNQYHMGHMLSLKTNELIVDNQAPHIVATGYMPIPTVDPDDRPEAYVRIGDQITFYADVASDPVKVTVDLSPFGGSYGVVNMTHQSGNRWQYQLPGNVPEGTINIDGITNFQVWAYDSSNNATSSALLVPIDNQRTVANTLGITIAYKAGFTDDYPDTINLNKTVNFVVNFTAPVPDDAKFCIIDLSDIGHDANTKMQRSGNSFVLLSPVNVMDSGVVSGNYQFTARIYDKAGNQTAILSSPKNLNCKPPRIISISATAQSPEPLIINDQILFEITLEDHDNNTPTVDLSSIAGSSAQAMNKTAEGTYSYLATIGTGTYNWDNPAELLPWPISITDSGGNTARSNTNPLKIDNLPPQINGADIGVIVTGDYTMGASPRQIRLADELTFTVRLSDPEKIGAGPAQQGSAKIDLRAVGGNIDAEMTWNPTTTSYEKSFTATLTAQIYNNHKFEVLVLDENGNQFYTYSVVFDKIDCQPIELLNHGIEVSTDPSSLVAGIGTTLTVFSQIIPATITEIEAVIGTQSIKLDDSPMTYNSDKDRFEAFFLVKTPNEGWPELRGSTIYYTINATDSVGNYTNTTGISPFRVYNLLPEIDSYDITLNPNYNLELFNEKLVFNKGHDLNGDLLHAELSFADAVDVASACIDFVEFATGTIQLKTFDNTAFTETPVSLDKLPSTNWRAGKIWLKAEDLAGNRVSVSKDFWVDNSSPEIVSTDFNGATLTVEISETFNNFDIAGWTLIGSDTAVPPNEVKMNFSPAQVSALFDSFQISLTLEQQKEIVQWASTTLHLEVKHPDPTLAPLTDLSGNIIRPINRYPITISDSEWREPPVIQDIQLFVNWPNSLVLEMTFTKEMSTELDPDAEFPTIGSNALLFVDPISSEVLNPNYSRAYIFQETDQFEWVDNKKLRITLAQDAKDWVARKLSNDMARKLKFATRPIGTFVYDKMGKKFEHISVISPRLITDNRPVATPVFHTPRINLTDKTLSLTLRNDDHLLLNSSDFRTDTSSAEPKMLPPLLNVANRINTFHKKIILYENDKGNSRILVFEDIDLDTNDAVSSNSVILKLTDQDMAAIFDMFSATALHDWKIEILQGAFKNLWGTANERYTPDGPDNITGMDDLPEDYEPAEFAAFSMNDIPPVSQKNPGDLVFEIEIYPPTIDGTIVPLQRNLPPKVRIILQDEAETHVASGTFDSYSERTVDARLRSVFRYTNTTKFPDGIQIVAAKLLIEDISDIFGSKYSEIASHVYNINHKDNSANNGFSSPDQPLTIDSLRPSVVIVEPSSSIGRLPRGSNFFVNYSEPMDPSIEPVLVVATITESISFKFENWQSTEFGSGYNQARFTNNAEFDKTIPNGPWTYTVTGAYDIAGNLQYEHNQIIEVRTQGPEVDAGNIALRTVQSNISNDVLIDKPWSPIIGEGTFSIIYSEIPTERLPHRLEILDPTSGLVLASKLITSNALLGTATLNLMDFSPKLPLVGPVNYQTRLVDSKLNRTQPITTIVYDVIQPDVEEGSFKISGNTIGSYTADAIYYRKAGEDFGLELKTNNTDDDLRLALYRDGYATSTLDFSQHLRFYSLSTGKDFDNGKYILSIVDLAGNPATDTICLMVDDEAPNILEITPQNAKGTDKPWYIANSTPLQSKIEVQFSEKMDATPGLEPVLWLATSTPGIAKIEMTFEGWLNNEVATTAIYANTNDINEILAPPGTYGFMLSGGRDLAGNSLEVPQLEDFEVIVQSAGPVAIVHTLTNQQHIYGTIPPLQTDLYFNPAYGAGSATLQITYQGGPFNTPPLHSLVLMKESQIVATYPDLPALKDFAINTSGFDWGINSPEWDTNNKKGHYSFRLIDGNGKISANDLQYPIYYDTDPPKHTGFVIDVSPGISSSNGAYSGFAYYYSPKFGAATFNITTANDEKDTLGLILKFGVQSLITEISSVDQYNHSTTYGESLTDGVYTVTSFDLAGNEAIGPEASVVLVVDSIAPQVVSVTPPFIGAVGAREVDFILTFNEEMNTAIVPILSLATTTIGIEDIELEFVTWIDGKNCRFTNTKDIQNNYQEGVYSYIASSAADLAGNLNIIPGFSDFDVEIFRRAPDFTSALSSIQPLLFGNTTLINRPFSRFVAPEVATLSIDYREGPFQIPHEVRVFDATNRQVATFPLFPDVTNRTATATVDYSFFGGSFPNAPNDSAQAYGPANYYFRILDDIGNISHLSATPVIYDSLPATVNFAEFSTPSPNSSASDIFYNEQLHGALNTRFSTDATDAQLLVLSSRENPPLATITYNLNGSASGEHKSVIGITTAAAIPEGEYSVTIADLAGNMAIGAAAITRLRVDRTPPNVDVAEITTGVAVTARSAGTDRFRLVFNELLDPNAPPTLRIATNTYFIDCGFVGWGVNTAEAIFKTNVDVEKTIPQGEYTYNVWAKDLTGNEISVATGTALVSTRGPVVSSYQTISYQSTTAKSPDERLFDQPFSFVVSPGMATLSVRLARPPAALPVELQFRLNDQTVDSHVLQFDSENVATFTWSPLIGPSPIKPTTYELRLIDAYGNHSLETHLWRLDNEPPIVTLPEIKRGIKHGNTVYFNPVRDKYLQISFITPETETPRLRLRGANSTDTYDLYSETLNLWEIEFDGTYSKTVPKKILDDGLYMLDLVDLAGNVAMLSDFTRLDVALVIDTKAPLISHYSLLLDAEPVTNYSPSAGPIDIRVYPQGTIFNPPVATDACQLLILDDSGAVVRTLPLSWSQDYYKVRWDGKDEKAKDVMDGLYKVVASDLTGNKSENFAELFVITSTFSVVGINQISASSAKIWFDQEIEPLSLVEVPEVHISVGQGITIGNIMLAEPNALRFDLYPPLAHEQEYTFVVAPGTVRSVYGAIISDPYNIAVLVADTQGPLVSNVSFEGIDNQKELKVVFDEEYKPNSAREVLNYILKGAEGTIPVLSAIPQPDMRSVKLTLVNEMRENQTYTIEANNIEDIYSNYSPVPNELAFRAPDLTPPEIKLSAFSNPINENDVIAVVVSNELLSSPPTLRIAQSGAVAIDTQMHEGSEQQYYMMGISLSSAYPGNAVLIAQASDVAGNTTSVQIEFVVAYIRANSVAQINSSDGRLSLQFVQNSINKDATVTILTHELQKTETEKPEIKASLQNELRAALPALRASAVSANKVINHSELEPLVDQAYEIGIDSQKVKQGFNLFIDAPEAMPNSGVGLFYQDADEWKFITRPSDNQFAAKLSGPQIVAVMKDNIAPNISLSNTESLSQPLKTARPEFRGKIEDFGSGVDANSINAHIDNGPAQFVQFDAKGNFLFIPQADLTGGKHDLIIKASDNTGNETQTDVIRFQVLVPLQIHQIMQYPNPARNRAFIRISTNRGDISDDLLKISIYDTAGHLVNRLTGVRPVKEDWGINSRYLYDIPWDLTNSSGKRVANGLYYAKVELRDPDNPSQKIKKNFKLAVLR